MISPKTLGIVTGLAVGTGAFVASRDASRYANEHSATGAMTPGFIGLAGVGVGSVAAIFGKHFPLGTAVGVGAGLGAVGGALAGFAVGGLKRDGHGNVQIAPEHWGGGDLSALFGD